MRSLTFITVASLVALPVAVSAQTNSLFGNRGPIGQGGFSSTPSAGGPSMGGRSSGGMQGGMTGSSFGGSSMNSSSLGNSSFGGGSTMGSGLSSSGLSGGGLGGGGFGGSGMSGGMSSGMGGQQNFQLGSVGQSIGTGPVVGQSDNRGRQVGNRMAGQAAMGMMQALQGLQGLQRGGGNNQNNGGQNRERLPIRPTQRIAFDYTAATPTAAVERVSTKFSGIAERRPELADVTFLTDDAGRIVLRGDVESTETAQLAAALVRLEPGVRDVVNELTVNGQPAP